jgi:hypothetical protein
MVGGLPDLDPRVKAVVCLGYPFHPTGQPEKLRLGPLKALRIPALVVQGTRDPYGDDKEVATYTLPPLVTIVWSENGNHDLAPDGRLAGDVERQTSRRPRRRRWGCWGRERRVGAPTMRRGRFFATSLQDNLSAQGWCPICPPR